MKTILITLLLIPSICFSQFDYKELKFPVFGWTVNIPNDIDLVDTSYLRSLVTRMQYDSTKKRGIKEMEYMDSAKLDFTLFTAKKGKYNILIGLYLNNKHLFKNDEDFFKAYIDGIKDVLLQSKMVTLQDPSFSKENIDGLEFLTYKMKINYTGKDYVGHAYVFLRKFNKKFLLITTNYLDEDTGEEYLKIIRSSKFVKKSN